MISSPQIHHSCNNDANIVMMGLSRDLALMKEALEIHGAISGTAVFNKDDGILSEPQAL